MLKSIFKPIRLFDKKKIIFIFFLIFISPIFELIGLGALLPLISAILEKDYLNIVFYNYFEKIFLIENRQQFINIILLITVLTFFFKFILVTYIIYKINGFTIKINEFVSNNVLKLYLNQNLLWHSDYNKTTFINLLISEVKKYTSNTINPLFYLVTEIVLLTAIIFFLFFLNIKIFLLLMILSILIFLFIFFFSKKVSYNLGRLGFKFSGNLLTFLNENLSGIKEIILYSKTKLILEKFNKLNGNLLRTNAKQDIFQELLRYILEFMGVILLLTIFYMLFIMEGSNTSSKLGTLGVYFASLFKILPIYNRISTYSQRIRFGSASAEKINKFLDTKINNSNFYKKNNVEFKNEIYFKNISFKYEIDNCYILNKINLKIKINSLSGITGKSGSGKTTLSNIIMGLVEPSDGKIYIDGKDLSPNNQSFSNQVGFVSQNLFSLDDSILNNITLQEKNISYSNLKFALKNSLLLEDIISKKLRLKKKLGDNILKVSGGQLQRINIARALYRRPKILILDEPTSALDYDNQSKLIKIILNLKKYMAILLISHDDEVLSFCDEKFEIINGNLNKL